MAYQAAITKIDRAAIMRAAWTEFRNYNTFSGIRTGTPEGRRSFGQFLRQAWQKARAAASLAATTVGDLAARLAAAERRAALALHTDTFTMRNREHDAAVAELASLRTSARLAGLRLAA